MSSSVQDLARRKLIHPPDYVVSNIQYECLMGSVAYGVSSDTSDCDIYGFCIPPKEIIFPHLDGYIYNFGEAPRGFDQYMQHHVEDIDAKKSYDFTIYGIVKYFNLCMQCNPNMIDSLFVPENCVKHATIIGQAVRDNRKLFLSKEAWPKFKGYAYSQLHKIAIKNPDPGSKRAELVERFGFDTKFAYHVVRLLDEASQIFAEGDIDLQRNREELKAIRRGEIPEAEIRRRAEEKIAQLETVYHASTLRGKPDEKAIKQLLIDCLEHHYGNIGKCVVLPNKADEALQEIDRIIDRYQEGTS